MAKEGILTGEDRVELIRGEIVPISPNGSRHAACIGKITDWLIPAISPYAKVRTQDLIQIPDWSEPEPDIVLVKPRADHYVHAHPTAEDIVLLVEVADSSVATDRTIKSALYAEAGIAEYWIVNLPEQQLDVYRSPQNGRYEEMHTWKPGETLHIPGTQIETPVAGWLI